MKGCLRPVRHPAAAARAAATVVEQRDLVLAGGAPDVRAVGAGAPAPGGVHHQLHLPGTDQLRRRPRRRPGPGCVGHSPRRRARPWPQPSPTGTPGLLQERGRPGGGGDREAGRDEAGRRVQAGGLVAVGDREEDGARRRPRCHPLPSGSWRRRGRRCCRSPSPRPSNASRGRGGCRRLGNRSKGSTASLTLT